MSNQWEINEWGSTSDLGWLPFSDVDTYPIKSFIAEDITYLFTTKSQTYFFTAEEI